MTQTARDLENTFVHAWELLVRNWILVLPGFVFGVLAAAVQFVLIFIVLGTFVISGNGTADAAFAAQVFIAIIMFAVTMVFALAQIIYVTAMAGGAWRTGISTFADGWDALSHRLLPVVIAAVLQFLIAICAAVLAPVTFFVSLLIYAVFFIYTT